MFRLVKKLFRYLFPPRPYTSPKLEKLKQMLDEGVPLERVRYFARQGTKKFDFAEREASYKIERAVSDTMFDRTEAGKLLEKQGRIAEAVQLYEANLRDEYWVSTPYDRLRILYTRSGDIDSAIRVCEKFIAVQNSFSNSQDVDYKPNEKMMAHFSHHIEKLKAKK